MSDNASVVIFPAVFAHNKLDLLVSNIKKILEIQNQKFQKIRKDDSVIVVEANDPVFASSAINLLFGIERVAIAKQVKNEYDTIVSAITKIGSNLLLKGDRFYVKVDGQAKGYLPKDIEITATSSLIEKTIKLGAKPGTEDKYDKLLYTYLTKSKIELEFFQILINGTSAQNYLLLVETVTELILSIALLNKLKRVSLAVSPLVFPQFFIDRVTSRVYQKNIIPHIPLSGIDENILDCAKEIGLEKYLSRIERLGKMKFNLVIGSKNNAQKIAQQILKTKRVVTITVGPNNVHDILDGLESNH